MAEMESRQNVSTRFWMERSEIQPSPWVFSAGKRCFDVVIASAMIVLLIPVLLLIAAVIFVQDGETPLYGQWRVGANGREFRLLKFRTMLSKPGPSVTAANDSRILPFGRILRRWKLDELPQLVNIVAGEMSIVGPRPKLSEHTLAIFPCRPGLTCAATIAFISEETLLEGESADKYESVAVNVFGPDKAIMDSRWVEAASFTGDLLLIVKTVYVLTLRR